MRHFNKKIEITRIFKHFILEWDDKDAEERESSRAPSFRAVTSGTEVYDSKEDLIARIEKLL